VKPVTPDVHDPTNPGAVVQYGPAPLHFQCPPSRALVLSRMVHVVLLSKFEKAESSSPEPYAATQEQHWRLASPPSVTVLAVDCVNHAADMAPSPSGRGIHTWLLSAPVAVDVDVSV